MTYIHGMTSIVIPSRNEKYLQKTVQGLLESTRGLFEILIVLDGYWPKVEEIVLDSRVHYIHLSTARGMRNAINTAVSVARGEYILKTDAHCMFEKGYDIALKNGEMEDDWVVVPRRYRLDPEKWELIHDHRPPIDHMYLDNSLKGVEWRERNHEGYDHTNEIEDLMTSQGSCWFMKRDYYNYLELLDEKTYGPFYKEMQEIGLKCWLSGGRMVVNKNTWYAHWHKTEGRGYSLDKTADEIASKAMLGWKTDMTFWHKTKRPLVWLFKKFGIPFDWKTNI